MKTDKLPPLREAVRKLRAGGKENIDETWAAIEANDAALMAALTDAGLNTAARRSDINIIAFPYNRHCLPDVDAALAAGNIPGEIVGLARCNAKIRRDAAGNRDRKRKTGARGFYIDPQ